jgi:DHA2 family multidrug resistance protein
MADHDCVMSSIFMEVLDTTVVNVSLPHIAGDLSATDEATWTLTSYPVANAIILPMTGWLATTFGHKRLLMLSVIEFTAALFLWAMVQQQTAMPPTTIHFVFWS